MNGAEHDVFFSGAHIEMLCDGVFAIAMTLLVLELKVPALPRSASSSEILHALGEHGLAGARRQQLLAGDAGGLRAFGFALHPLSFALSLLLAVVMPGQAIQVLAFTQVAIPLTARRRMRLGVPTPSPALS